MSRSITPSSSNALITPEARFAYIPGLDGLRAISVLIVIIAHLGYDNIVPGGFGVTVFFFISGFLITRLLIAEAETSGRISLGQFYLRRFARLYPALIFMIAGSSIIFLSLGIGGPSKGEVFSGLFYFANIYQVHEMSAGTPPFMSWTHLWSLAVEEHFYLLFPLLMGAALMKWRRAAFVITALILVAPLWRFALLKLTSLDPDIYIYMMTDTRLDSIAWGCLLSLGLHMQGARITKGWLVGWAPIFAAGGLILASLIIREDTFRHTLRYTAQGAALMILMLNLYFFKPLRFSFAILEWSPLAWVGTVSYALYLWHYPVIDLCQRYLGEGVASQGVAVAASLVIAAVSYTYVEKPFLALRKKLGSHGISRSNKGQATPVPIWSEDRDTRPVSEIRKV